ncbi:C-type lectin-like [Trinorchestia longiramus]|nr:C-type lectin-like [Trinorchestia longiramus]
MPCLDDFIEVEDVGCMFLSNTTVPYAAAKTSCPPGSDLFSPDTTDTFRSMQEFLLQQRPNVAENYWIGIERKADGVTWQWRKGSYIDQDSPSPYWAAAEPNGGSSCCRMTFIQDYSAYSLADDSCDSAYSVLCEQF